MRGTRNMALYPSPGPLALATLSLQERDARKQVSNFEN
jgi:hypothetical protein